MAKKMPRPNIPIHAERTIAHHRQLWQAMERIINVCHEAYKNEDQYGAGCMDKFNLIECIAANSMRRENDL